MIASNSFGWDLATESKFRKFYAGRKALVVGADGFLGVNCVNALNYFGANLTLLTRRSKPRVLPVLGRYVTGDIRDTVLARELTASQDLVFNFIGVSSANESNSDPQKSLLEELQANLSLFHACALSEKPPLVINFSSRLVYGKPQYLPVDELHPLNPQSVYAVHKLTAEHYLQVLALTHGLPYIIFRLSNPYGPNQYDITRGYGVINRFLQNSARGLPIMVFGDGHQRRDYIYIEDVVRIYLECALTPACRGEVFNIGGSSAIGLAEAAELIAEVAGGTPVQYVPWPEASRIIETGDYVTDLTKLKQFIDLPGGCSFKTGFERTIDFYRNLDQT